MADLQAVLRQSISLRAPVMRVQIFRELLTQTLVAFGMVSRDDTLLRDHVPATLTVMMARP
jgi:hypothetical protein